MSALSSSACSTASAVSQRAGPESDHQNKRAVSSDGSHLAATNTETFLVCDGGKGNVRRDVVADRLAALEQAEVKNFAAEFDASVVLGVDLDPRPASVTQAQPEDRPKCECKCDCGHRPGKGGRRSCGKCNALVGPGCCWVEAQGLCHLCIKDEPDKGAGKMRTPPLHLSKVVDKDLIEAQLHCELQTCSCKRINMNHAFRVLGEKLPRCHECAKPIRSHSLLTGERIERVTVLGRPPVDIPGPQQLSRPNTAGSADAHLN